MTHITFAQYLLRRPHSYTAAGLIMMALRKDPVFCKAQTAEDIAAYLDARQATSRVRNGASELWQAYCDYMRRQAVRPIPSAVAKTQ